MKELPAELDFKWLARWPMRSLALTDTNRLLNFHLLGSSVTFSDDILSVRSIIFGLKKVYTFMHSQHLCIGSTAAFA